MATLSIPGAVLFACNLNRVRSPMAEALLRRLAGDAVFVDSCGLKALAGGDEPAAEADPFAQVVMAELGCDLSRHGAKTFEELRDQSFDLIICLTPQAQVRAVEMTRGRAIAVEHWPIPDPTATQGSREVKLAAYREVRDALMGRIAARFGP